MGGNFAFVEFFAAEAGPDDGEDETEEEGGDELGGVDDGGGDGDGGGEDGDAPDDTAGEVDEFVNHGGADEPATKFAEDIFEASTPRFEDDGKGEISEKSAKDEVEEAGGEIKGFAGKYKKCVGTDPKKHGDEEDGGSFELDFEAGFAAREDNDDGGKNEETDGEELGNRDVVVENEYPREEGENGRKLNKNGDTSGFFVGEGAQVEDSTERADDAGADGENEVVGRHGGGGRNDEYNYEGGGEYEEAEDFLDFGAAAAKVGVGDEIVKEGGERIKDSGDNNQGNDHPFHLYFS